MLNIQHIRLDGRQQQQQRLRKHIQIALNSICVNEWTQTVDNCPAALSATHPQRIQNLVINLIGRVSTQKKIEFNKNSIPKKIHYYGCNLFRVRKNIIILRQIINQLILPKYYSIHSEYIIHDGGLNARINCFGLGAFELPAVWWMLDLGLLRSGAFEHTQYELL